MREREHFCGVPAVGMPALAVRSCVRRDDVVVDQLTVAHEVIGGVACPVLRSAITGIDPRPIHLCPADDTPGVKVKL